MKKVQVITASPSGLAIIERDLVSKIFGERFQEKFTCELIEDGVLVQQLFSTQQEVTDIEMEMISRRRKQLSGDQSPDFYITFYVSRDIPKYKKYQFMCTVIAQGDGLIVGKACTPRFIRLPESPGWVSVPSTERRGKVRTVMNHDALYENAIVEALEGSALSLMSEAPQMSKAK